jgi:hypothetical protein
MFIQAHIKNIFEDPASQTDKTFRNRGEHLVKHIHYYRQTAK